MVGRGFLFCSTSPCVCSLAYLFLSLPFNPFFNFSSFILFYFFPSFRFRIFAHPHPHIRASASASVSISVSHCIHPPLHLLLFYPAHSLVRSINDSSDNQPTNCSIGRSVNQSLVLALTLVSPMAARDDAASPGVDIIIRSRSDPRDAKRITAMNIVPITVEELPPDYCTSH